MTSASFTGSAWRVAAILVCLMAGWIVGRPAWAGTEQQWRKRICDNFFVPDPLPALEASTPRRFVPAPGVRAEGLTYRTEFGLLVPAILYLPDPLPAGKIPAFIVVNGHGGDKYSWYSYYTGILFARGGAAVLTYDQAGEGERNRLHKSGTRAHDGIKGDAVLARHLAGLMITDVRQAVSYLSQRKEVDEGRIAAGGIPSDRSRWPWPARWSRACTPASWSAVATWMARRATGTHRSRCARGCHTGP